MTKKKLSEDVASGVRKAVLEGVGYGNPPLHSRFQKGASGNPNGRPRKSKSEPVASGFGMRDAVLAESRRVLNVHEKDGRTVELPAREVLLRSQFKSAVQGNSYAQENFLKRVERAEREEAQAIADENAIAHDYVARCRAEIEDALKDGRPEPEFLPHPDDIHFEPGKVYEIRGPATLEALEAVMHACKMRDVLLMQFSLNARGGPNDQVSSELFFIHDLEQLLPERLRLDDIDVHLYRYAAMSTRKLRDRIRAAWRNLGVELGASDSLTLPCIGGHLLSASAAR